MYSFDSRVRYSETDETGRLTVLGLINYMQDCSTFHSADVGVGVEVLEARHKAWMLSSWQILIDRWPRLGERIVIGTWHNESRGIYGYRNFVLRTQEGESLARAGSAWFLYDLDQGTPVRVEAEDAAGVEDSPCRGGEAGVIAVAGIGEVIGGFAGGEVVVEVAALVVKARGNDETGAHGRHEVLPVSRQLNERLVRRGG